MLGLCDKMGAGLTGSKICYVCQLIQNRDNEESHRCVFPDRFHGILSTFSQIERAWGTWTIASHLDLVHHVEGIRISGVRENNLDQGICHSVSAVGCALKCVAKVCFGILNSCVSAEDDKACDGDTDKTVSEWKHHCEL